MNTLPLQKVALRQRAVYLENADRNTAFSPHAADFCAEMYKLGYVPDEKLLHALNGISKEQLADIYSVVKEVLGLDKNWTPLVKNWLVPTGESRLDHLVTMFANLIDDGKNQIAGVRLPCGHLIPKGTFPIERYNGCPFCGTPFEFSKEIFKNQASKRKVLTLWTLDDVRKFYHTLLASPVTLDATQRDSLIILLENLPLPEPTDLNLFRADASTLRQFERLPATLEEATALAVQSEFLRAHIPAQVLAGYGIA